ncbi:MAG: nucleotide sugar dehydrogenase, partial [Candidatus Binataceae bacterium]
MRTTQCVSVVGLGKLGACLAASAADMGAQVIGVDTSEKRVKELNSGIAPVAEPGLSEMITRNRLRLSATTDMAEAVARSQITFVVVPTPSESHGGFHLGYVEQAMESIGRALASKRTYHLVVLTSTVLPGAMENRVAPILERSSGMACGKDFGLCYNPEFIALGSVLRDLVNPDFVLIGQADSRSGDLLEEWYQSFCDRPPAVRRMDFVNAELTKISVNTFITTKIAFANTVAQLCERLPGADVDVVTRALGFDSRIGPRYLTGGLGYGGPCFPRDNQALAHVARTLGIAAEIATATDLQNRALAARIKTRIAEAAVPGATVGVIGLAYKPNTAVVEESQSLAIACGVASRGHRVVVFDSIANEAAHEVLGDSVVYAESVA